MAKKTDAQLLAEAQVINDETAIGGNTKGRVANMLKDIIDSKASIDQLTVSTASGTITLDMGNQADRMFKGSGNINGPKTWIFSNTTGSILIRSFIFVMTTLDAQTMPANVAMSDARWDGTIWTPQDVGQYEATASFDGTNWLLKIEGPFSV